MAVSARADRRLEYVCPAVFGDRARRRLIIDVPRLLERGNLDDTPAVRRACAFTAIRTLRELSSKLLIIARVNGVGLN